MSRENVAPVWQFDLDDESKAARDEKIGVAQCAKACREKGSPFFAQIARACFCIEQEFVQDAQVMPLSEGAGEGGIWRFTRRAPSFPRKTAHFKIESTRAFEMTFSDVQNALRDSWLDRHRIMTLPLFISRFAEWFCMQGIC